MKGVVVMRRRRKGSPCCVLDRQGRLVDNGEAKGSRREGTHAYGIRRISPMDMDTGACSPNIYERR
jgi:hypothetical protein